MQHTTVTDKSIVYVSIVPSQRAQSHTCTLNFATFTPGGKFGNPRPISDPMGTHMRNASMKATKMKPYHPTMKWADAHFELKVPTCVEVPSQKSNKCKKIVSYGLLMPVQGRKQTNSARHGAKNAIFHH